MPVTGKLSLKFYERLGEDVTNELVEWLNQVDATYRSDLKELNELNFARFDAKVEQRFAESEARLEARFAEAEVRLERRFAEADVRLERRFAEADAKVERRLADVEVQWGRRLAETEARVEKRIVELDGRLGDVRADLIKWTFVFVAGGTLSVIGAILAVLRA